MDNKSVREGYDALGVETYYKVHESDYSNPHEPIIKELITTAIQRGLIGHKVLDLCCGSGEITRMLTGFDVTGVDPYTENVYKMRTGNDALTYDFKDIAEGKLNGMNYDTIICSFAMHLCPESMLSTLLWQLGQISKQLIIVTPHKRPDCDHLSGWVLVDEYIIKRVRMRCYIR